MPSETASSAHRLHARPSRFKQPTFVLSALSAIFVLIIFCLSASAVARTIRLGPIEKVHWSVLYNVGLSVVASVFFTIQCAYYQHYSLYTTRHRTSFWIVFGGNFVFSGAFITAIVVSNRSDYSDGAFFSRLVLEILVASMAALLSLMAGLRSFCRKEAPSPPGTELAQRQREWNEPYTQAPQRALAARDSLIRIHNELNSPVGSTRRNRDQH